METHPYGGGGNVIIEDCERCELNWLDHGELERIVQAPDREYASGV
jgi:Zn-finger nucleic acid-binding protein